MRRAVGGDGRYRMAAGGREPRLCRAGYVCEYPPTGHGCHGPRSVAGPCRYDEEYGSLAKFAVMCPATAYWQDAIAAVVLTLSSAE